MNKDQVDGSDTSQKRVDQIPKQRHEQQPKPVAWMQENEDCTDCFVWEKTEEHTIPLYTTPSRQPLTDEQIELCFYQTEFESVPPVDWNNDPERWCKIFVRAIEQAHGIRGEE